MKTESSQASAPEPTATPPEDSLVKYYDEDGEWTAVPLRDEIKIFAVGIVAALTVSYGIYRLIRALL